MTNIMPSNTVQMFEAADWLWYLNTWYLWEWQQYELHNRVSVASTSSALAPPLMPTTPRAPEKETTPLIALHAGVLTVEDKKIQLRTPLDWLNFQKRRKMGNKKLPKTCGAPGGRRQLVGTERLAHAHNSRKLADMGQFAYAQKYRPRDGFDGTWSEAQRLADAFCKTKRSRRQIS